MSRLFADLSNNNPHFDAAKYAKAGHVLVGLKATEGTTFVDKTMAKMAADAHKNKISVAYYHFARPKNPAAVEARFFWQTVKPHFQAGDYLVLDLEANADGSFAPYATTIDWAIEFGKELRKVSKHAVVLYTSQSWLLTIGPKILRIVRAPRRIWMAQYASHAKPPMWARPLWAWQRTGDGVGPAPHTLPGCPPNCDVNVLNVRSYRRIKRLNKRK